MTVDPHSPDSKTLGSETRLLLQWREGDEDAIGDLWRRYFERLLAKAEGKMRTVNQATQDAEDVTVMALTTCFNAIRKNQDGRYDHMDRSDFWGLLSRSVSQKIIDQINSENAHIHGGGRVRQAPSPLAELENMGRVAAVPGNDVDPTPEQTARFQECFAKLVKWAERHDQKNGTELVAILQLWMRNYDYEEIAEEIGAGIRAIKRALQHKLYPEWERILKIHFFD